MANNLGRRKKTRLPCISAANQWCGALLAGAREGLAGDGEGSGSAERASCKVVAAWQACGGTASLTEERKALWWGGWEIKDGLLCFVYYSCDWQVRQYLFLNACFMSLVSTAESLLEAMWYWCNKACNSCVWKLIVCMNNLPNVCRFQHVFIAKHNWHRGKLAGSGGV